MKFLLSLSFLLLTIFSNAQRSTSDAIIPSKYATELGAVTYSDVVCSEFSFSVKVQTEKELLTFTLTRSENSVIITEDNNSKEFEKNNEVFTSKSSNTLIHRDLLLEVFEDFKGVCNALVFTVPSKPGETNKKDVGSAHWSKRRCAQEISDKLGCGGGSHVSMDCVCVVDDYACVCYGGCN